MRKRVDSNFTYRLNNNILSFKHSNSYFNFYISNSNRVKSKRSISRFDFEKLSLIPKPKRSQTTLFIILALILISIIILTFTYNFNFGNSEKANFNQQTNILANEVKLCFENLYKESINEIGIQGGYFYEPLTEYLKNDINSIPFYYFGELDYIPEPELIQEQIIVNIDSKKEKCFNLINSSGINYEYNYKLPNVSIKGNEIEIKEKIKLILSKENLTHTIDFNKIVKIKSNIVEMNSFSSYIAYSYELNNESICLSCFQEIALNKNFIVEIDDSLENILIITITETKRDYYPRFYNFAMTSTKDIEKDGKLLEDYEIKNTDNELNLKTSYFENE